MEACFAPPLVYSQFDLKFVYSSCLTFVATSGAASIFETCAIHTIGISNPACKELWVYRLHVNAEQTRCLTQHAAKINAFRHQSVRLPSKRLCV